MDLPENATFAHPVVCFDFAMTFNVSIQSIVKRKLT